ncbi:MAG: amylo-alpha-1,6-glucosidase [Candidatus Melainabacteria bacterium]|nr:amylo-alpha-1,6-glucosidase [Candidatus Melainabacteria bacterium]
MTSMPMVAASASVKPLRIPETTEIPTKAFVSDQPHTTVKHGKLFFLMNGKGLVPAENNVGQGLYSDDTRFLHVWDMRVNDIAPVLISADTREGFAARFAYSNQEQILQNASGGQDRLSEQRYFIDREVLIGVDQTLNERIRVTNFDVVRRQIKLTFEYGSDFADMFEVRGWVRKERGHRLDTSIYQQENRVVLSYMGLDWMQRSVTIELRCASGALDGRVEMTNKRVECVFDLGAGESETLEIKVSIAPLQDTPAHDQKADADYANVRAASEEAYQNWLAGCAQITTDNTKFNELLDRTYRDIYMLRQVTPRGTCVSAGVPWFAVAFGRDQEVTGLSTLPFMPQATRQILEVLLGYMGTKDNEYTEERAGRILHELRTGEMARLHEHPFLPYYGTVDATPLFLVLMAEYARWSADYDFVSSNWEKVERALAYIDRQLTDGGGYLSYGGKADAALSNQGWKDSNDSVMDASGKLADAPIALSEVQGYLYHSWNMTSQMALRLGKTEMADHLAAKARRFKRRFQRDFWMKDRDFPALALCGADQKQCDVVASNAGHLLFTGILSRKQALATARGLMAPEMFSGFGIRTLASSEARYNPLSYHDGSIWPHDNGIAAWGMAAIGQPEMAAKVLSAMFDVALTQPDLRLPELFCGFERVGNQAPVRYPVSCSPQAWAAASVLMMLAACLGFSQLNSSGRIKAALPDFLNRVEIRGLRRSGSESSVDSTNRGTGVFDLTAVRMRNGRTKVEIVQE